MADFVNTLTLELRPSENASPGVNWTEILRVDLLVAAAIPQKYRKWTGSAVAEMTPAEKSAVDAAIETTRENGQLARYDARDIERAEALVLIDEINALRQWIVSFKAQVAASSSLSDLKNRVATLPDMPDRTAAQARSAIVTKLGGLT